MQIINLTPHNVTIDWATIPPSGQIARVSVDYRHTDDLDYGGGTLPFCRPVYGDVQGLPDAVPGTVYVVSSLVQNAAKDRDDLVVPADLVRDDHGRVIGCNYLAWRS